MCLLPTHRSLTLQQPQEWPFLEWGNSLKSGKTAGFPGLGRKRKPCLLSKVQILKSCWPSLPRPRGPARQSLRHQVTPALCKGVLMAATTWGPQTREPHCSWWLWGPRRGKEKLALTLQNNAARWGGVVGGPHKEVSVRRAGLRTMAPQKPVPGGKQRISIDMT